MKKIFILMYLIVHSILVNAQTIQENDITIEYEINDKTLIVHVFVAGVTDECIFNIYIADKVHSEYGWMGAIGTELKYSGGSSANLFFFLFRNDINHVCDVLTDSLSDTRLSTRFRNKSANIVALIRDILVEAMETGILNLADN